MANPPVTNPAATGIDAHDAQGVANNASSFRSQGDTFAAQYIDQFGDASTGGSPSLSTAQVQQDAAAGLSIVSIFQTNGMSSAGGSTAYQTYFTRNQGASDGTEAIESAEDLNQPTGSTIYFAFDFDPAAYGSAGSETALLKQVQTYVAEAAQVVTGAGYKIGFYGAGDTLAAVIRNSIGTAGYTPPNGASGWLTQSYGWAGSNSGDANAAGWQIYQQYPSTTQNGVSVDVDKATTTSLGQWNCFTTGTLIRTIRGDISVEMLSIGDLAVTMSGAARPIRWIGHRTLRCSDQPDRRKLWPFRILAGALGIGRPERDLWLSPEHALCLDGVLVPVHALAQRGSIEQVEVDEITYWHVELDSHDILLANGAPAESYLETGNRHFFNAHGPSASIPSLPPDAASGFCLPLVASGRALAQVRAHLFGAAPDPSPAGVHIVADERIFLPHLVGSTATFVIPATAREVRLCSASFRPVGRDVRTLGVLVSALAVCSGDGERTVSLDHPALFAGFHEVEQSSTGSWRWTDGDGHISPDLWVGAAASVMIRVQGAFASAADDRAGQLAA